jgi:hypothetical protein
MLNRKISIFFIALLLAMLCAAIPAWADGLSHGPQAPAAVNVGDQFNVSMVVNNAVDLMGTQFKLQFNPALLQADKVSPGNIFTTAVEDGALVSTKNIDNVTGIATYLAAVTDISYAYTGSGGTTAVIKFTALAPGQVTFSIADDPTWNQLCGELGVKLDHTTTTATVTINEPVKPVITPVQPVNGATGVALGALVQAASDVDVTAVDLSGVTIKDALNNPVSGVNATLGGDNRTLTIAHNAFAYSTAYTVTIPAGAVMDGGLTNDLTTWNFTTLAAPPVKPVITPVQPVNGATGVALGALVQAASDVDVTAVDLSGVTIKDALNNPVSGVNATLGGDNRTLTIAHNAFAYSTAYTVTIPAGAVMDGGLTNDLTTWNFTTLAAPPEALNVTVNLTGDNISPDRPLTIDGSADRGGTPAVVDWSVVIKDPGGNTVDTCTPASGDSFNWDYIPVMDLPVVADYTVQVTATPGVGDPVTVERTFNIYNYPLIFSASQIDGSEVTSTLTNLSANDINQALIVCQVVKEDGVIQVKQLQTDQKNISASGGTANINFTIDVPTVPGTYAVVLFAWSKTDGKWVTLSYKQILPLVII